MMGGGILPPGLNFAGGGLMGGDLRQVGGDFLAKALDPEGPPPAQKTLRVFPVLKNPICFTSVQPGN